MLLFNGLLSGITFEKVIFSASDTEEYREWLHHEVFSESRRHIYLNHSELRTVKAELTKFCSCVLDEPGFEQDDEIGHGYKMHTVSSVLRKQ